MTSERWGLLAAALAYTSWGAFPLYFRALAGVPAAEILAHRIGWSVVLLGAVLTLSRGWVTVRAAGDQRGRLLANTVLLSGNWLIYLWAIETGRVLQASLGYFVTPLVSVGLGLVVLGERLRPAQAVAVGLAALGVIAPVFAQGEPPWIALGLAATFGTYGLLRKGLPMPPVSALFVETAMMAPLALGFLAWRALHGEGAFGSAPATDALLIGTGLLTTVPLLLFAVGARRLPLTTMGLLQYLSPVGQLLVALLVFDEALSRPLAFTFATTWAALALISVDALWQRRRFAPRAPRLE